MSCIKVNHIHPIYSNEESRRAAVKKELKKVFTAIAARKHSGNKAVVV